MYRMTNMSTVRKFEIISSEFNIIGICTSGNYTRKWFTKLCCCCSVSIVTRLEAGRLRVDFRQGLESLFLAAASRPALGNHPAAYAMGIRGVLSPGVKRRGHEADHSPPFSAQFKNAWSCTSTPQYIFMA
jgi:hypothetical protein